MAMGFRRFVTGLLLNLTSVIRRPSASHKTSGEAEWDYEHSKGRSESDSHVCTTHLEVHLRWSFRCLNAQCARCKPANPDRWQIRAAAQPHLNKIFVCELRKNTEHSDSDMEFPKRTKKRIGRWIRKKLWWRTEWQWDWRKVEFDEPALNPLEGFKKPEWDWDSPGRTPELTGEREHGPNGCRTKGHFEYKIRVRCVKQGNGDPPAGYSCALHRARADYEKEWEQAIISALVPMLACKCVEK